MKRGVDKLLNKRGMKFGWVMLTFVLVFGKVLDGKEKRGN